MDTNKIKRAVLEPKVYALIVSSTRGQVLHLGVHFSLEDAYAHARKRLETLAIHTPGEAMDIQLWNSMPARQVMAHLTEPSKLEELGKALANTMPLPAETTIHPIANGVIIEGMGKLPPILEALLSMGEQVYPNPTATPVKKENPMETPPTVNEYIQDLKDSKNDLMKKLIDDGDVAQVEKFKGLLGGNSRRYVLKAIEKNALKKSTVTPTEAPKVEGN